MEKKKRILAILLVASFALSVVNCSSSDEKAEGAEGEVSAKCVSGNCKNGTGTLEYSNGDKYEGEFKDSKFEGEGSYTFANGDNYKGAFAGDKFNGKGTYTFANGDLYEGDFKDDLYDGKGKLKTKAATYQGDFKAGKMHGKGVLKQPDGDSFEGDFLADLPYKGVVKSSDGKVKKQYDATKIKLGN
jgi:hypothetical protein